jgi:predicted GNAT family acetyltransferase
MVSVVDNPDLSRYEIRVEDVLAGFAAYRLRPGLIGFFHTEISPSFAHRGLGGQLVEFALGDARERDLAVLPFCPFVNRYLAEHPEQVDLVPAEYRAQFGLPAAA